MLEFFSPSILWALSLLSIPVILHFLKNINPRTFDFSSISFLKNLQKKNLKQLSILQYLLLLLRLLFMLFLILAFAQPRWQTNAAITFDNKNVYILFDNSFSTYLNSAEEKPGTQFFRLIEKLNASAGPQTLYQLVAGNHSLFPDDISVGDFKAAVSGKINYFRGDIYSLLNKIKSKSASARETIILVYSDMQLYGERDPGQLDKKIAEISQTANIFFVDFKRREDGNNGINDVRRFKFSSKPSSLIEMDIVTEDKTPTEVTVYHDKSRIAQKMIQSKKNHHLKIELGNRKVINGLLELENDAFEADNYFYWGIDLGRPSKMLLVGDSLALKPVKSILSVDNVSENISLKAIQTRGLFAEGGVDWDWVFLAPDAWNRDIKNLINRLKKQKANIFLIPGKNLSIFATALKSLTGLTANLVSLAGNEQAGIKNEKFSPRLSEYPIRAFARRYFKLESKGLLKFDNGSPLVGISGGYYIFSAPLLKDNGNIRLHPGLPMWFLRWIPAKSNIKAFYPRIVAGKDTIMRLPNHWKQFEQLSLIGKTGEFVLTPKNGLVKLAEKQIAIPGIYSLKSAADEFRFAVNISPQEFEKNVYQVDPRYKLDADLQGSQFIELWKFALLIAILFLGIETLIRSKYGKLTE